MPRPARIAPNRQRRPGEIPRPCRRACATRHRSRSWTCPLAPPLMLMTSGPRRAAAVASVHVVHGVAQPGVLSVAGAVPDLAGADAVLVADAVATPRKRACAVPVPVAVARTCVPWPFWSFQTPAASLVKVAAAAVLVQILVHGRGRAAHHEASVEEPKPFRCARKPEARM